MVCGLRRRTRSRRKCTSSVTASGQHLIENEEVGSTQNLPPIPPGAADWKITAIQPFTQDVTLNTMQPHMHLRGKDMTYIANYPDGREEILLSVPKYDFNWQNTYIPNQPYQAAGRHRARDGWPLRQLCPQSRESHAEPAGAVVRADVGRDVQRVDGNHLRCGDRSESERCRNSARPSRRPRKNNPITTVVGCVAPGSSPLMWRMTNAGKLPPLPPKENQSRPEPGAGGAAAAAADNGGGGPASATT